MDEIVLYPNIHLGATDVPIKFTSQAKELEPNRYQIWEFETPSKPDSNGCFFIVPPYAKTNVAHIIDDDTQVKLRVTGGSGYCPYTHYLPDSLDAQRQIAMNDQISTGDVLTFGKNDIYALIAGPDGLIVQDETSPPFRPGATEANLDLYDSRAPTSFWKFVE